MKVVSEDRCIEIQIALTEKIEHSWNAFQTGVFFTILLLGLAICKCSAEMQSQDQTKTRSRILELHRGAQNADGLHIINGEKQVSTDWLLTSGS